MMKIEAEKSDTVLFYERLKKEQTKLTEKIEKLDEYLNTIINVDSSKLISEKHALLMRMQLIAMQQYKVILAERIDDIRDKVVSEENRERRRIGALQRGEKPIEYYQIRITNLTDDDKSVKMITSEEDVVLAFEKLAEEYKDNTAWHHKTYHVK